MLHFVLWTVYGMTETLIIAVTPPSGLSNAITSCGRAIANTYIKVSDRSNAVNILTKLLNYFKLAHSRFLMRPVIYIPRFVDTTEEL